MPAYTHLQRAQVTSLAQHLLAYFWMLERDRGALRGGARRLPRAAPGRRRRRGPEFRPRPRRRGRRAGLRARRAETRWTPSPTATSWSTTLPPRPQLGGHLSRLGAEIVAVGDRPSSASCSLPDAVQRRLQHHAAEAQPRRRRAHARRGAAPRRRPAGLLGVLHGLPLAYNTDLREDKRYLFDAVDCLDAAAAGGARPARRSSTFDEARMAAACDPLPGRHRRGRLPRGRTACPSARRTTSPAPWCARCLEAGVRARRRAALDELARSSPAFDDGYYGSARAARARSRASAQRRRLGARSACASSSAWPRRPCTATPAAEAARAPRRRRPACAPATWRRDHARPAAAVVLRAVRRSRSRATCSAAPSFDGVGGRWSRSRPTGRTTRPATATAAARRATPSVRAARAPVRLLHLGCTSASTWSARAKARARGGAAARPRADGRARAHARRGAASTTRAGCAAARRSSPRRWAIGRDVRTGLPVWRAAPGAAGARARRRAAPGRPRRASTCATIPSPGASWTPTAAPLAPPAARLPRAHLALSRLTARTPARSSRLTAPPPPPDGTAGTACGLPTDPRIG